MESILKKVLVVYSGGLDSTTVLHHAVQNLGVENVSAVSFNYGSKHNDVEIEYAKIQTKQLGVKHQIVDLDFNKWGFKSDLLKSGGDIPEGHYEAKNMAATVVPFRNGIMLSIAAGIADSIRVDEIWLGSHAGDHEIYLDCRIEFTEAINKAIQLGTDHGIKVVSPFNDLMKWDLVQIGIRLGIDYSKTYSCYNGVEGKPCGKCGTCVERTEAFIKNYFKDPAYNDEGWESAVQFYKESILQND